MSDYYEILGPEEITISKLSDCLKRAYIRHEIDDDGDILVTGERISFSIIITNNNLVKLMTVYTFKPESDRSQRLELCNKCNFEYVFTRFCVHDDKLGLDYYISTKQGLPVHSFIFSLKQFINVTADVIKEADTEDIIK